MEGISRSLLASNAEGDPTAPFFGFIGAASALVFSCTYISLLFEIMREMCVVHTAIQVATLGLLVLTAVAIATVAIATVAVFYVVYTLPLTSQALALPMALQSLVWALLPWV